MMCSTYGSVWVYWTVTHRTRVDIYRDDLNCFNFNKESHDITLCLQTRRNHVSRKTAPQILMQIFFNCFQNTSTENMLTSCIPSQTQRRRLALFTQCDDGQPLEREQGWATFVVNVLPPWQPPPHRDWRGESGDRCLTTPSRPRLWALSHPRFACAGFHSNWTLDRTCNTTIYRRTGFQKLNT